MDPHHSFCFQEDPFWAFSSDPFVDLAQRTLPAVRPLSVFIPYIRPKDSEKPVYSSVNTHRRMLELLRRIPEPVEDSPRFRHMKRERQRREKLSQSYVELFSVLSCRPKKDKISIVQSAVRDVRQLKVVKEELRRRNEELRARIARLDATAGGGSGDKVTIRAENLSSYIDSMIGTLRCLKSMDVQATAIRSDFSNPGLSAVINIESNKASAAEMERAVAGGTEEGRVGERDQLRRSSGWPEHCRGENKFS